MSSEMKWKMSTDNLNAIHKKDEPVYKQNHNKKPGKIFYKSYIHTTEFVFYKVVSWGEILVVKKN